MDKTTYTGPHSDFETNLGNIYWTLSAKLYYDLDFITLIEIIRIVSNKFGRNEKFQRTKV